MKMLVHWGLTGLLVVFGWRGEDEKMKRKRLPEGDDGRGEGRREVWCMTGGFPVLVCGGEEEHGVVVFVSPEKPMREKMGPTTMVRIRSNERLRSRFTKDGSGCG
ncbi:hypothetical protein HAX54_040703 [Datura stramonium]|uniref:Secreted protein n=1 Tax=Datura stramonium TaxID=4076 RepID=A0ABS8VPB9_DATST|nr:hypothetical protein [Datura stramonium]